MSEKTSGETKEPAGKGSRRVAVMVVLVVLGLVGAGYGWRRYTYGQGHAWTDDAFVQSHITRVSPRVSGQVARVAVVDNQDVKAGDVLVELDRTDYEADLRSMRSKQAAAAADLAKSRSGLKVSRAKLEAAQAQRKEAEAKAAFDQSEFRRTQEMFDKQAMSQQQLDSARMQAEVSSSALGAAQQQVLAAEASVAEAESGVASAEADVQSAAAETAIAELRLSYTRIVAPVDGRVTRKAVLAGEYVQAGQPMVSIVELGAWVEANFKETDLGSIRPGQSVSISIDAFPGRSFSGRVDSIQGGTGSQFSLLPPQNATGNYIKIVQRVPVKIVFDPEPETKEYFLVPGMSVVPVVNTSGGGGSSMRGMYTGVGAGASANTDVGGGVAPSDTVGGSGVSESE